MPIGTLAATEQNTDLFKAYGLNHFVAIESQTDTFFSVPTIVLFKENVVTQNIICSFVGDTLANQIIPLSFLTARYKKDGISSANIVIPNGQKYDQIVENFYNDNGSFAITYIDRLEDGSIQQTVSQAYSINAVSSSRGGRNWSINLSGDNVFTLGNSINSIELSGVSLKRENASGSFTLRARLDRRLLPYDRAVYDGVEYSVENITHVFNDNNIYMEVST